MHAHESTYISACRCAPHTYKLPEETWGRMQRAEWGREWLYPPRDWSTRVGTSQTNKQKELRSCDRKTIPYHWPAELRQYHTKERLDYSNSVLRLLYTSDQQTYSHSRKRWGMTDIVHNNINSQMCRISHTNPYTCAWSSKTTVSRVYCLGNVMSHPAWVVNGIESTTEEEQSSYLKGGGGDSERGWAG